MWKTIRKLWNGSKLKSQRVVQTRRTLLQCDELESRVVPVASSIPSGADDASFNNMLQRWSQGGLIGQYQAAGYRFRSDADATKAAGPALAHAQSLLRSVPGFIRSATSGNVSAATLNQNQNQVQLLQQRVNQLVQTRQALTVLNAARLQAAQQQAVRQGLAQLGSMIQQAQRAQQVRQAQVSALLQRMEQARQQALQQERLRLQAQQQAQAVAALQRLLLLQRLAQVQQAMNMHGVFVGRR